MTDNKLLETCRAGIAAILVAAPLMFGSVEYWAWAILSCLLALVVVLWSIGISFSGGGRIHVPAMVVPALLMLGLILYQLFGHKTADFIATREALIKYLLYGGMMFLTLQLMSGEDQRQMVRVGLGCAIFASLMAIFAIVQFLSSPSLVYWTVKPQWGGWIFGPYIDHAHYAGFMEMILPVGIAYSMPQNRRRALLVFGLCLGVLSIFLCASRGGIAAALFEAVLGVAVVSLNERGGKSAGRTAVLTLSGLLVLCAVGVSFVWLAPETLLSRMTDMIRLGTNARTAARERAEVSVDSLRMFREHVIVGSGLGSFETVFPSYQTEAIDLVWDHAHNDYAEFLAETGCAGAAVGAVALVLLFYQAWRNWRERSTVNEGHLIRTGAAIGCAGLLLHGSVDFNLHIPANALWFAFLVGLATGGTREAIGAR